MHFAASAEKACPGAADRRDRAQRGGDPLGHQHAEHGRPAIAVWDEAPGNQSYRFERGDKADVDAAFAAAAHIVEIELINNRLIVAPTSRARRSAITLYRTEICSLPGELRRSPGVRVVAVAKQRDIDEIRSRGNTAPRLALSSHGASA